MIAKPVLGCLALVAALWGISAPAAPFRPDSDSVVVATLPGGRERSAPSNVLIGEARSSADPAAVAKLAFAYVERGRAEGDPRQLGRAQALLARWNDPGTTPLDILVLQATIDQSLHQFDRSLQKLNAALHREPRHAQALLTRATVLQVQGRFDDAARDCALLGRGGDRLVATTCGAGVESLRGQGRRAYVLLDFTVRSASTGQDTRALTWARFVLGGIAERSGDFAAAKQQYEAALRLNPQDRYVRAAYADFLLDRGDAQTVLLSTANDLADDGLLLRQAIARARLGRADRAEAITLLAERHAAARRRGDSTHLREEARFELQLRHDARRALGLAVQNWASPQREPEDARILLEAAVAAGDAATERMARAWFRNAGVAEQYVAQLARPYSTRGAHGESA